MPSFAPQEIFIPEDGQTEFTLPHPYVMGTGELRVYLNGILAVVEHDYVEVDNTTINFLFQLTKEDVIITQHMVYFDEKYVKIIDNAGKGLYQKYGVEDRLLQNQKYELTFRHGFQTLTASFYTRMTPLYSTVEIIRNDLPEVFKSLQDQTIRMQLYLNSVLARNIAGDDQLTEIDAAPPIPYYAKQYVRYRTELDLLVAMYIALTGKPSSDHIVLGSLEVEKRFRVEDVKAFIAEIKAKLKPWENALKGSIDNVATNLFATAVRGGTSNEYPLNTPRRDVSSSGFGSDN